jgi:hypothetical protein
MWCVPVLDEAYVAAMTDVLATYERPLHDQVPVVCIDEKCVELRRDVHVKHVTKHGIRRRDAEYERNGTANVFVASEPKAGRHWIRVTKQRRRLDFAEILHEIANDYPNAKTIHLVMDNLNTHNEKSAIARYGEYEGRALWARFTPHHTPKHGSWLNQAEITINLLTRICLRGTRIADIQALNLQTRHFEDRLNQSRWTIDWKWTAADARRWVEINRTRH